MTADNRVEDFDAIAKRLRADIAANGGAVSYEVTVKKIERIVVEKQGDWGVRAQRGEGVKDYDYLPSRPEIIKRETITFQQALEGLSLADVVKAVNGLK